jgi:hypothetical protein
MRKLIGITVLSLTLGLSLSSCAGGLTRPAQAPTEEEFSEATYREEQVPLKDGRTVTCIYRELNMEPGDMSCDWENAE